MILNLVPDCPKLWFLMKDIFLFNFFGWKALKEADSCLLSVNVHNFNEFWSPFLDLCRESWCNFSGY